MIRVRREIIGTLHDLESVHRLYAHAAMDLTDWGKSFNQGYYEGTYPARTTPTSAYHLGGTATEVGL